MTLPEGLSRRTLLVKLGIAFNTAIAAVLAVPIVRYLMSPVIHERKGSYDAWVSLGNLEQFPSGQTRFATYRNPVVNPWDGTTGDIACWVRNVDGKTFQVFAINCAHLGCPVRWFPQSEPVPVPLPWRRLLPGWLPRLRSARTRTFRVRLQTRIRKTFHQSGRNADAGQRLQIEKFRYRSRDKTMRLIKTVVDWLGVRLPIDATIQETAGHQVPRDTASWFYVFGSAALVVFMLQIITGIMLAFIYVPSAGEAWNSLQVLNHNVTLGWFIRAMHGWGSDFMVAIVLIHMVQVFLFGAYKFPRELTWVVGILLLIVTLGMAFTGQVLRFDQDAYWGLGIGASIASRVPILGPPTVNLMLGGPIIAGATLSRFFALHVFIIPGLLISFVAVHLLMVLRLGINEWPMPGRVVRKATYIKDYHELTKRDGVPFVPGAVYKDLFFGAFIIIAIAACAIYFGPFGPSGAPDPTIIQTAPRPDYFFLWLYAVLSLLPPSMETPALLIGPVVVLAGLILLPFIFGEGEKSWRRRPIAVLTILLSAVALGNSYQVGSVRALESGDGRLE